MSTVTRWIPRLIMITAALHLAYGVVFLSGALADIARAGVVNTLVGHEDRLAAVWFIALSPALFALGALARWAVGRTGELPAQLGMWLLALSLPMLVLIPASGFWLVAAIGVLVLVAAKRQPSAQVR